MANSDDAFFLANIQSPLDGIHKELRVIAMLLRQGFNLTDEDSSLTQQTQPTLTATPS